MNGLLIYICGVLGGLLLGVYASRLRAFRSGLMPHDDRCGRADCDGRVVEPVGVCTIDGVQHISCCCRHTAGPKALETDDDPPPGRDVLHLFERMNGFPFTE